MLFKPRVFICFVLFLILSLFQVQAVFPSLAYADERVPTNINRIYVENDALPKLSEKIKFIAETEGQNLQYEWNVYKDGNKLYTENYTTNNYFEYIFNEVGNYKVEVNVKDEFSNICTKSYDNIEVKDDSEFKVNSITIDKNSPQLISTPLKITVDASGKKLNYQWSIYNNGKEIYNKPYGEENFIEYTPQESGIYKATVTVKNEDEKTLNAYSQDVQVVNNIKLNGLTMSKSGKQLVNTPINFAASAEGYNLVYHWYIYKDSNIVYDFPVNQNNNITYTPNQVGTYKAVVYVKDGFGKYISKYSDEIIIYKHEVVQTNSAETMVNGKDFSSKTSNFIYLDTQKNIVYVFEGKNKSWKIIRTMSCTDGKASTPTPKGNFTINGRGQWLIAYSQKVKAKYKVRITGDVYFHSILFNMKGKVVDSRLGQSLSHGCVRLSVDDAKWVYDNIKDGTAVHIE